MLYKFKISLLIIFLPIFSLLATDKSCLRSSTKIKYYTERDFGYFDVNRITTDFENNGMFVTHNKRGQSGMEWPKFMGASVNFVSGIWIADSSNGGIRVTAAEYAPECTPGPFGVEYDSLKHKIYTINKFDFDSPYSNPDFISWPIDDGAPWIDNNNDGIYNVSDDDAPDMLGDQMHWYVCNDGVQENHSVFHTNPINIEMQVTTWGYNGSYNGQSLQDVMFVKTLIINKGQSNIENAYIGLWSDPDLGYAGDDFVGCDTTLNIGYCYNDGPDNKYGDTPPAHGIALLQGPIVKSTGNNANAFGRTITDYQNVPLTAFVKYI